MTLAEWLDYIERQHPRSIDMGLDRVRDVAARLGPGRPAERVITVGGTNGKGSTVAFVEAIAREAGWRVGCYTSPHLLAYNERVRIDGVDAGGTALVEAFEAVESARGDTPLTYFEYGTLAALWLFGRAGLDLVVLEVGLGGRLDATNIVDADVAVITTVDLDHQDWLGADREAIGFEKAGIARAWRPVVLGDDDPPSSVLGHAYAIGASALRIGCDFFFDPSPEGAAAGEWRWREVGYQVDLPRPRLEAPAQLRNAAVAIAALRALDWPDGKDIGDEALARGVANASLPGRLQRFDLDGVEVVVDVAHNPQAAAALAQWLQAEPVAGRTHAVYAALADKDAAGVASAFGDVVGAWYLAGLEGEGARSCDSATLRSRLAGSPAANGSAHADVATALQAARAAAGSGDRILVFGSFLVAAEALRRLQDAAR